MKYGWPSRSSRFVKTSQPVSVTSRVCSNCADRRPSCVTDVQLSGHVWSRHVPNRQTTVTSPVLLGCQWSLGNWRVRFQRCRVLRRYAGGLEQLLSLHFDGHFPGEPGLAGVYWSKGWWRWWRQLDYWSYKLCKAPVKSSPPTNQHRFLQAGCPSCHPTNSVKALKWKYQISWTCLPPKLTWGLPTLSLTTNTSWLPWGRVAMCLISRPMPVHQGL